jgi:hypothetical protein
MTITNKTCPGCKHSNAKHYFDIAGIARCNVIINTVSISGVIGLRGTYECDCENGTSENKDRERKIEEHKKIESQKRIDQIVKKLEEIENN